MKPIWRTAVRRGLLFAVLAVIVAGGLPFLLSRSTDFLGQDMTSLAAGVVGFYPWIAVAEVLRVILFAFAVIAGVSIYAAMVGHWLMPRRWVALAFPGLPIAVYLLVLFGRLLEYPALFDGLLPTAVAGTLFRCSFYLSPQGLYILAWVVLLLPGLAILVRNARSLRVNLAVGRRAAAVAASLVALAVVAMTLTRPAGSSARGAPTRQRNLLLIGVDSLRADRLGRPAVSPNLSALAEEPRTVRMNNHWIGIPRTFPSWVELLTGEYAARNGIRHMFPAFSVRKAGMRTLPAHLRASGYRTAVFSDFAGDIFPRFDGGFAEVYAPSFDLRTMIRMSVDQSFPFFMPLLTADMARTTFGALKESPEFGDPRHLAADFVKWLHNRGREPWFATIFFSTAHFPYSSPYPYYRQHADSRYGGPYFFKKNPDLASGAEPTPQDVQQVRALYDGAVQAVDEQIGVILGALQEAGLEADTVVAVTADHGEDLFEAGVGQGHGEHLRGENVLRVPFLLRLAAPEAPTVNRLSFVTRSVDLAPTLASAVGSPWQSTDGHDLTPWMWDAAAAAPSLSAYAETGLWFARRGPGFFQNKRLDYPGIAGLLAIDQGYDGEMVLNPAYERLVVTAKHRMLLSGRKKVIYMPTAEGIEWEIYDQVNDPNNQLNLVDSDKEETQALQNEFFAYVSALEGAKARLLDGFVVPE